MNDFLVADGPRSERAAARLGERVLSRASGTARYRVRLAEDEDDVQAAQTLRFLVFNLELNEGLEESFVTCRDTDPFDAVCDHLLVEDAASREVVGTYRLQPGPRAAGALGFYCDREFDLAPFAGRRDQLLELGRACVHRDHRNLAVLALLWSGIHQYARHCGARFLMGCSSLPTTDPAMGARAYSDLMRRHLAPEDWRTMPRVDSACPLDRLHPAPVPVPKLLSAYLSLGAWLCGPPALDREFKTVDFLTVLDLAALSPRAKKILTG